MNRSGSIKDQKTALFKSDKPEEQLRVTKHEVKDKTVLCT